MEDWKKVLYRISNQAETSIDRFKLEFRQRMGWATPVQICPYMTFGESTEIFVKGRVLHDKGVLSEDKDTLWENLVNMYKRFSSNEIAGARLMIKLNNTEMEVVTDEDGYFELGMKLNNPLPSEELWHHPVAELLESPVHFDKPIQARCRVMTPPSTARFGVISDIDDTILVTNAQSLMSSAFMTFLNNAHTRLPFHGVAAFYQALQKGLSGAEANPIFYVSSSPWNLYDFLVDFKKVNHIPVGPIFLKDYGFTHDKMFSEGHAVHKPNAIRKILNRYPSLNFILIGDSGQEDPEIYSGIVKEYPGRILAVYIRDVSLDERDLEVKKISEGLLGDKVEMVLAENSYTAALHAVQKKFINESMLGLIREEKKLDEKTPDSSDYMSSGNSG